METLENFRLVVFRAVAEQLSFRKAAEELYLTQPAVSLQIKALEEDLQVQLFDRSGARVRLTPPGEVLLHYAREAHAHAVQARAQIAQMMGDHAGSLALGASTTIAQYVLPRMLAQFRAGNPRVSLSMISGNTEEVVHALEEKRIALGFIEGPARSRQVKTEQFLLDEMRLIAPAAHEWSERRAIAVAEVARAPLILRERGSGSRDVVESALEAHGLSRGALTISMELDSSEAIKSAVEAGLGVGFVSQWALAKDVRVGEAFTIVDVAGLRMQRDLLVAFLKGPEPDGPAKDFRRFVHLSAAPGRNPVTAPVRRADKKPK